MSTSAPQQPLKSGITFADVQSQPNFLKATPAEQLDISNGFFDKHVASQPGFINASPEEQVSIRQGFNKKYGIDQLASQLQSNIQSNINQGNRDVSAASDNSPLQLLRDTAAAGLGVGANAANGIGLGLPNLATKALTGTSLTDLAKQGGQAIGASPGVYNDPFGIQSTGGQIAGAVGALPKVGAMLGKAALPAFSAIPEISNYLQGNSTLPQAAAQTGINLATSFIPGGQGVIQNALKQGAGQAVGGLASSALNGGNFQQNLLNALREGTIGAFLGGAHAALPVKAKTSVQEPVKTGLTAQEIADLIGEQYQNRTRVVRSARQGIEQAKNFSSVNEQNTLKGQITQYKKLYENLHNSELLAADPVEKHALNMQKQEALNLHNAANQAYSEKYGAIATQNNQLRAKADKVARQRMQEANARVSHRQAVQKSVDKVHGDLKAQISAEEQAAQKNARRLADEKAKERQAQANARVKQRQTFEINRHRELQKQQAESDKRLAAAQKELAAELKATATEQEKLQKLKQKEAAQSAVAKERAESQNRKRELNQLKASITERNKVIQQKEAQARSDNKALNQGQQERRNQENRLLKADIESRNKHTEPPKKEKSSIPKMEPEAIRAEIKKAEKSGESIEIRYHAEKYGETGQYQDKTVHNPKLDISKNGQVMVRGINSEGQPRTYLERDSSGSQIVGVKRNGTPSEYKSQINPETGKEEVLHIESGEIVQALKKDAVKSSEIRKQLEVLEKIKAGKKVMVSEIMEPARSLNVEDSSKNLEQLPPKARTELHERITGEPCN